MPEPPRSLLTQLLNLSTKRAVVTGAGRGIGAAVAHRLGEAGATVVISDIDGDALADQLHLLSAENVSAIGIVVDSSKADEVEAMVSRLSNEGPIDIWINNAGVLPAEHNPLVDLRSWDHLMAIDLRGVYVASRSVAMAMKAADRGGVIVNIASTVGLRGFGGMPHYVAAKHGVVGLTAAMAGDLAPFGIRVLAVAPSLVTTPGMEKKREVVVRRGELDPLELAVGRIPLGRVATPDDIARVVLFCVSELASFVTGITIPVDGGRLAWEP